MSLSEVKAHPLKYEWFPPGVKWPLEVLAGKEVGGIWFHIL